MIFLVAEHNSEFMLTFTEVYFFFIPGEFCLACFDDQRKIVRNVGWQTCGLSFSSHIRAKDRVQFTREQSGFPRYPDPSVPRMNGRHPSDSTRIPSWTQGLPK